MDPNANLWQQLELAQDILKRHDNGQKPIGDDAAKLAELVLSLHIWINSGGFLPDRWEIARKRAQE